MKRVMIATVLAAVGCMNKLEEQTKSTGSIVGQTTQDIGKLDKSTDKQETPPAKSKEPSANPADLITAPLGAYGPALESLSKSAIAQALNIFKAEHDRFPKDYDEFMEEIIKKNNIKLPVLPGGKKYRYDEEKHELVVVDG